MITTHHPGVPHAGVLRERSSGLASQWNRMGVSCSVGAMTRWFDTDDHAIVPELTAATTFTPDVARLLAQLAEARTVDADARPVIIGPVSYLARAQATGGADKLALLPALLATYSQLLHTLAEHGVEWVQVDEPILVTALDAAWQHAFNLAYHELKACRIKLLVATRFGALSDNLYLAANLPVAGLHVDAIDGRADIRPLLNLLPGFKVLSLGVIDGRTIGKTDVAALLDWLAPLAERLGDRLWLAPSCSPLHVPVNLPGTDRRAFAMQQHATLQVVAQALADRQRTGCTPRDPIAA